MNLQLHIFAWALVVSMAAVAVTTVAYAVDAVDGMAWRWRARRIRHGRLPLQAVEPDGEICLCCTSRPYTVDDCNCRTDCGQVHCQAADPPPHIEGCGPGSNMLAYPSLACTGCDWIAGRTENGRG